MARKRKVEYILSRKEPGERIPISIPVAVFYDELVAIETSRFIQSMYPDWKLLLIIEQRIKQRKEIKRLKF